MYHCDTFDTYFHWKQLQKRAFLDRDFGCKSLVMRTFNCGVRIGNRGGRDAARHE